MRLLHAAALDAQDFGIPDRCLLDALLCSRSSGMVNGLELGSNFDVTPVRYVFARSSLLRWKRRGRQ